MYSVYVLKSLKDDKRYVGMSAEFERRLKEHQLGMVKSTRHRRPFQLVYKEDFETKTDALKREKFFKSGKGRDFLSSIGK